MPVLRFQFARRPRALAVRGVCRCLDRRSGIRLAAGVGAAGAQHLLRRRYAEFVSGRSDRSHPASGERAPAHRAGLRDHPRNQSRYRRARSFRGLPQGRRESLVVRRAKFRRRLFAATRTHPRQRPGRSGGQTRAGCGLRQSQSRSDVCVAGANHRDGRIRSRARVRVDADAYQSLPIDVGAEHLVRGEAACRHSGR